jgi:hypothetical protein
MADLKLGPLPRQSTVRLTIVIREENQRIEIRQAGSRPRPIRSV